MFFELTGHTVMMLVVVAELHERTALLVVPRPNDVNVQALLRVFMPDNGAGAVGKSKFLLKGLDGLVPLPFVHPFAVTQSNVRVIENLAALGFAASDKLPIAPRF